MPICPFCGVHADAPHETQEGCIEALHAEIARLRAVLDQVHSIAIPHPPADDDDPEDEV